MPPSPSPPPTAPPGTTTAPEVFDRWALDGRADRMERGHFTRAEAALKALGVESKDRCLDVGCGNGWATRWMRRAAGPYGFAAGVDAAGEMVEQARSLGRAAGVQYRCASFTDLPWKDAFFDRAFSMEALYYALDLDAALASVARVMKEGGALCVVTDYYAENPHCRSWPADLGVPMTLLDEGGWVAALEGAGFDVAAPWRSLDPRPADPAWSPERREREMDFRANHGSLVVQGTRR